MAIKCDTKQIDIAFKLAVDQYYAKTAQWLASLGERMVAYARDDKSAQKHYTDRTGNLRQSIGYAIVQNGKIALDRFGSSGPQSESRKHAEQIAGSLGNTSTYLIVVAGMEYARYVEAKGFDVITGSGDWVESQLGKFKEEYKRYLMSKKR